MGIPACVDTTNSPTDNQGITTYDTLPPGFGLTDLKEKKVKKCRNSNGQIVDVVPTPLPTPVPAPVPAPEVDIPASVDTTNSPTDNQGITTYDTLPPGFGLTDLKEKKVKKCRNS